MKKSLGACIAIAMLLGAFQSVYTKKKSGHHRGKRHHRRRGRSYYRYRRGPRSSFYFGLGGPYNYGYDDDYYYSPDYYYDDDVNVYGPGFGFGFDL